MQCGVCHIVVNREKDDHVVLAGSCKHIMHLTCQNTRVLIGGHACPDCPQFHLDPCDPLGVCDDDDDEDDNDDDGGLIAPLNDMLRKVSRALDAKMERTPIALMAAHTPIVELQRRGIDAHRILATMPKHGRSPYELIVTRTNYTPAQMATLGFRWEEWIRSGMNEDNFHMAYTKWGGAFTAAFVMSLDQLVVLCSGSGERFDLLRIRADDWRCILHRTNPHTSPTVLLLKAGLQPERFVDMNFSLQEWDEVMGLTPALVNRTFSEDVIRVLATNQEEEFSTRFGVVFTRKEDSPDIDENARRPASRGAARGRGLHPRLAPRSGREGIRYPQLHRGPAFPRGRARPTPHRGQSVSDSRNLEAVLEI